MPIIRAQIIEYGDYLKLREKIEAAITFNELREALIELLEHLRRIEYLGDDD